MNFTSGETLLMKDALTRLDSTDETRAMRADLLRKLAGEDIMAFNARTKPDDLETAIEVSSKHSDLMTKNAGDGTSSFKPSSKLQAFVVKRTAGFFEACMKEAGEDLSNDQALAQVVRAFAVSCYVQGTSDIVRHGERRPRLGAAAIVSNIDGDILLGKSTKGKASGLWVIPGGGVKQFEKLTDAVEREIQEETGLRVSVGSHFRVHEIVEFPEHRVIVYYTASAIEGKLEAGGDLSSVLWFSKDMAMSLELTPLTKQVVQEFFDAMSSNG